MSKVVFSKNMRSSGNSEGVYISMIDQLVVQDRVVSNKDPLQVFFYRNICGLSGLKDQSNEGGGVSKKQLHVKKGPSDPFTARLFCLSNLLSDISCCPCHFGAAMAKNTIRFDEFEQRLRSLGKIEDIYKKLHDIEKQIGQEKT